MYQVKYIYLEIVLCIYYQFIPKGRDSFDSDSHLDM